MKMAVGVVDLLADAIEHVNAHGTGHSEAIVTCSRWPTSSRRASTRRSSTSTHRPGSPTGSFGMGAEIGNSTQKLHAAGRSVCAS